MSSVYPRAVMCVIKPRKFFHIGLRHTFFEREVLRHQDYTTLMKSIPDHLNWSSKRSPVSSTESFVPIKARRVDMCHIKHVRQIAIFGIETEIAHGLRSRSTINFESFIYLRPASMSTL